MRILGIDPGSNATGFGVVERSGGGVVHVAHGTLRPRRGARLEARLSSLQDDLAEVIAMHEPDVAVVEQVFVSASPRSALVLGQARGAVLAALGRAGLVVSEVAATAIKQAVAGSGRASKQQVQTMVRRTLALDRAPGSDASDALAAAISHAHASRLAEAGVRSRGARRGRSSAASWTVRRAR